jgi:hypothetical protein
MLADAVAAEVSADISELPSAVETYHICPTCERKRPAAVAVPATEEKLQRLYQLFRHASRFSNLLSFRTANSVSCFVTCQAKTLFACS